MPPLPCACLPSPDPPLCSLLNKITPDTFDSISEQIVNVGINDLESLQKVIFLIFDKALLEPKFASLYAQLCYVLSRKFPRFPEKGNDEKQMVCQLARAPFPPRY